MVTFKAGNEHRVLSCSDHNHESDPIHLMGLMMRSSLKRRANQNNATPAKIVRQAGAEFSNAVQQRMSLNAQRKIIDRVRKSDELPKEPTSLAEFEVPISLRTTVDGESFLMSDIKEGSDRAIIFGTLEGLRRLALAKYWIVDGTFDCVPGLFRQLFTILGSSSPNHEHAFPIIHTLMTAKNEALYRAVFATLIEKANELGIDLDPPVILSDFEKAIINAIKSEFPETKQNACFFHLSQNFWKRIQEAKLIGEMTNNIALYHFFKKTQALAFLPTERIPAAFENLKKNAPVQLKDFISYVDEYYIMGRVRRIGKDGRIVRTEPLYPPSLWSIYDNVLSNVPRTTNQIEAWHRRWQTLVARQTGVIKLMGELRLEEKYTVGQIAALLAGTSSKQKKTMHQINDQAVKNIVENIDKYQETDYLEAIAAHLGSKSK